MSAVLDVSVSPRLATHMYYIYPLCICLLRICAPPHCWLESGTWSCSSLTSIELLDLAIHDKYVWRKLRGRQQESSELWRKESFLGRKRSRGENSLVYRMKYIGVANNLLPRFKYLQQRKLSLNIRANYLIDKKANAHVVCVSKLLNFCL